MGCELLPPDPSILCSFCSVSEQRSAGGMDGGKQSQCSALDLEEMGGAVVSPDKGGTFEQGEHSLPTGAGLP